MWVGGKDCILSFSRLNYYQGQLPSTAGRAASLASHLPLGTPPRLSSPFVGYKNNNTFFKNKKEGKNSTLAKQQHKQHAIPLKPPSPLKV